MINLSTYIDNFYRIDRLLFIVLELDTANGLISNKRFCKMSIFWSINYHFIFETIYPQELGHKDGYIVVLRHSLENKYSLDLMSVRKFR